MNSSKNAKTTSYTLKTVTKAEKVEDILNMLEELFPEMEIPLDHKDPYTLLVAVLLSAQCTDERVNKITPKLFAIADNPWDMVALGQEKIMEIVRPCGLPQQKSKGIFGLSQILIDKYDGKVPESMEAMEAMPAVGHKTASVVMVQAFGKPAFPVDTHIHRLAYRWGLSNGKSVAQTEKDLKRLIPEEKWGKVHLQMIYYGRTYCPARGHSKEDCPICNKYMRKSLS